MLPPLTVRPKGADSQRCSDIYLFTSLTLLQLLDEVVDDLLKLGSVNSKDLFKLFDLLQEVLGHVRRGP